MLRIKKQKTTWYLSNSENIITWLYNMVCIKVQKITFYMAKIMVFIQLQQQRNHRVSIQL